MPISSPATALSAVNLVTTNRLLLPGIQRSFVWRTRQIETLFDSLLRGYPIGSMLLWSTRPVDNPQLRFLKLVTDYHGKDTHPPSAHPKPSSRVYSVLDGQQRLTALNIGLFGSHAASEHGKPRRLYIDLDTDERDAGAEHNRYNFEFRSPSSAGDGPWFPVSDACGLRCDASTLDRSIQAAGHEPSPLRRRVLKRLVAAINDEPTVHFHVETGDLDRVLNVFARVNKGGTQLTYVDLLVSTVTARWRDRNARTEITDLRRSMNAASPEGFDFSTDRIVKAGLVVLDPSKSKFHVDSFMTGNRATQLEQIWPQFRRSMEVAAGLLAEFGLSARTLPAQNVVIPLAYYAYRRGLKPSYVAANSHERDRDRVKAFVARTMLQKGYWTGAVDAVLVTTCKVIKAKGQDDFPLAAIEAELSGAKSITVHDAFIDELVSLRFGDRRTAVLLRLLFPHMVHDGLKVGGLDKDHIFPLSKFSTSSPRPPGVSVGQWQDMRYWADRLCNLQLLHDDDNRGGGKVAKMPKPWLAELSVSSRRRYSRQFVKYVPDAVAGAWDFWIGREESLRTHIERLLLR